MGAKMYRMWCSTCSKIKELTVLNPHYLYHDEYTIRFELPCCGSKWTENYINKREVYRYSDGYDKNGC